MFGVSVNKLKHRQYISHSTLFLTFITSVLMLTKDEYVNTCSVLSVTDLYYSLVMVVAVG